MLKTNLIQKRKGITLIALVVSIVVLLILTGVSISMLTGENGIITQAQRAKQQTKIEQSREQLQLVLTEWNTEKYLDEKQVFKSFLEEKFKSENVLDNGDGTYNIIIEGITFSIDNKGNILNGIIKTAYSENSSILELNNSAQAPLSNYKIYGNSIQNGTPTPDNPVEIQSVGNKSKNMMPDLQVGLQINPYTGSEEVNSDYASSPYIEVDFNKNPNYYLSGITTEQRTFLAGYNEKKEFVARTTGQHRSKFLLNESEFNSQVQEIQDKEIKYIRLTVYGRDNDISVINNWKVQLEEGTVATEYEPYGKYKIQIQLTHKNGTSTNTNIYLDEPLKSTLPIEKNNISYSDYIDFSKGKVVRYIKTKIFNGTDSYWNYWTESITENTIGVWYHNESELGIYKQPTFKENGGVCSHFKDAKNSIHLPNDSIVGEMRVTPGSMPPYIGFKVPFTNLKEWKKFLENQYNKGTPVTVNYVLITPTEETIDLPKLSIYEDYTKIEVLTEILPSKIEANYQSMGSD